MEIKNDRLYAESHEWVLFENETTATVGLSDFAQSELGDLVFVNLPQVGDTVTVGETFADVESVKAVSDIYSPVTGTVAAINEALLDAPQTINEDAYGAWLVKVENITAKGALMDAAAYRALTEK
ncbi:MAG TPA: glycine cleavage system protein GcvH [Candidatus Limiplasma sp.]|nr:glycine cleavage system protein GcvH [Candidatus Limiplasma sp.]HPS81640.1 glycine cleavage system protein GcvH [Candidatus Limiplasma sp.]